MGGQFQRFDTKQWLGLNEDENPAVLQPGELSIAQNIWRYRNLIGTRPGTLYEDETQDWDFQVSVVPGVGDPCQGLHDCSNDFDGTRRLIGIFGARVYNKHDNALDVGPTITAGADNLWTFADHAGRVYAAGGSLATPPDQVWYWGLNPAVAPVAVTFEATTGGGQIGAGYIFQKWNRLWINGMDGTTVTDNPMIARYSALNDGTSFPVANTIGGTSAIGGFSAYGSEFSTGWGSYYDNKGDFLLFLTNKRLYSIVQTGDSYTPFKINDTIATGCVSQRAFVDLGVDSGDAVYLSEKGIHSLRQSQIHGDRADRYLSRKIQKTFATLNKTRLKFATGAHWHEHGIVIFAVPTGSNAYNDTLLVLDVRDADTENGLTSDSARWYIWRLASATAGQHVPQVLIHARDRLDGKPYIYGGNRVGQIFRFTTANYSDMTVAYPVHMRTRHDDFDAPGVTKVPGNVEVWVESTDDYSINMHWVYDLGRRTSSSRKIDLETSGLALPFKLPGTLEPGSDLQRKVEYGTGHGETIAHDFQHTGGNQPFWISRVTQQVAGLGDEIGDLDS